MNKETKILNLIKENPMITQKELADKLNTTSSTVGVQIHNLQKKGYIVGRGYILKDESYVLGIGSSNIDVYGKSLSPIREKYDHPSVITTNVGGVTHNILENLAHLGGNIKFITAVGDDLYGKMIFEECARVGIDTKDSLIVENCSSGVFMQVLDDNNDMHLAMTDLNAIGHLVPSFLTTKSHLIKGAKVLVCDPAMPIESLKALIDSQIPIFLDPTSEALSEKIKDIVGGFFFIKPNIKELAVISGMPITDTNSIIKACKSLLDKGLKHIAVSLGADGCIYMNNEGKIIQRKIFENRQVINASGAGDAFMSAFIYCYINGKDVMTAVNYALAAGYASTLCTSTINPDLSVGFIEDILKEKKL